MDADGCGDGSVWEGRVFRVESALRRQWFVEREREIECVCVSMKERSLVTNFPETDQTHHKTHKTQVNRFSTPNNIGGFVGLKLSLRGEIYRTSR